MDGRLRDWQPRSRPAVTSKEASATATRLLQWKKHNDAKREVKARLQEDERVEEEESYLSLSKRFLPLDKVQTAALRNYQAAGKLRCKRLKLQLMAEQQQLDEETVECKFRPRLVARPRCPATTACQSSKVCRSSCAAAAANSMDLLRAPLPVAALRNRGRLVDGDVFERLNKPKAVSPVRTMISHDSTTKRISFQAEAAFIARQERDQVDRQRRRSELAARHFVIHKPRLSRHTLEICATLRRNEIDQRGDRCRREQKRSNLTKQTRYTIPAYSNTNKKPDFASLPFTSLIAALKQQEQRMRLQS